MARFKVIPKVGDDKAGLYEQPSRDSTLKEKLRRGDFVEIRNWEDDEAWLEAEYLISPTATSGVPGWVERRFLGDELQPPVVKADKRTLVRQCARIELQTAAGSSETSPAILADYLVALGLIETGLERVAGQLPGSDAIGPYQIDSAEWEDFIEVNQYFGRADRFLPTVQPRCAAFLTQREWIAFAELEKPGGAETEDGPFIPSFANLFHARLLGVNIAHAVYRAVEAGNADGTMADLVRQVAGAAAEPLIERRSRFLEAGGNPLSVADFDAATRTMLTEKLSEAFDLLKEHFPAFVAPAGGGAWMAHAETELKAWSEGDWKESTGPGRDRVVSEYFPATEYRPTTPDPWCGAFVAWCVAQAGQTPVKGGARAANWAGWGGVEVRDRTNIPKGAVVVLGKTPDSGGSGHVTFFNRMTDKGIECLGGNQSNRVKLSIYNPDRIVAVRWPDSEPAATGVAGAAGAAGATDDEVLTLARTIWGEARGEGREGMEAVAAVMVNRMRSGRYPETLSKVCCQSMQFSCWNANDPNRPKMLALPQGDTSGKWEECLSVAKEAAAGTLQDPTGGALHYHTQDITPAWVINSPNRKVTLRRGHHVFYTGIK